eukprot:8630459-Ditylum_brightwellii.AAC.1
MEGSIMRIYAAGFMDFSEDATLCKLNEERVGKLAATMTPKTGIFLSDTDYNESIQTLTWVDLDNV